MCGCDLPRTSTLRDIARTLVWPGDLDLAPEVLHLEAATQCPDPYGNSDPSALTRWVVAHPALWAIVAAAAAFAVSTMNFGFAYWGAWAGAAVAFGVLNIWLWRENGAGHHLRSLILRR